jgi:hypothetical protein
MHAPLPQEERTAKFAIRTLRGNLNFPWCQEMLARLELPPTVHHHARHRVRQRGGYDLNIWTENKRLEKLNYPHNNPLIWPGELADPSHIMQKLAEHTANSMRRNLRQNPDFPSQLSTVDRRLSTVN